MHLIKSCRSQPEEMPVRRKKPKSCRSQPALDHARHFRQKSNSLGIHRVQASLSCPVGQSVKKRVSHHPELGKLAHLLGAYLMPGPNTRQMTNCQFGLRWSRWPLGTSASFFQSGDSAAMRQYFAMWSHTGMRQLYLHCISSYSLVFLNRLGRQCGVLVSLFSFMLVYLVIC
jgi:hypothetical protein